MAIHSPTCENFLAELLTTPTDSVDHRLADSVLHLSEDDARSLLIDVMDDDHGTRAADIAHQIWQRAAAPAELEEQR